MSAVHALNRGSAERRQRAIERLGLHALPADPVLDGLVRVAARALRCPVAMVNMVGADSAWSLASTDGKRLWLPREVAFCSTAIAQPRQLVVNDLRQDARFARHPLVDGDPHIRFYAGVPIGDGDDTLGTLCVIDTEPRDIDDAALQALDDLARAASHWMAARREHLALVEAETLQRERLQILVSQRTAELQQATAAAEAASAAKSAFLATMSHEIRTPMNGVVGLIELVDRSGLPPHQQELMHAARDSAHTLLGLIDNILDFSKIESGRLELTDEAFELRRLVEGAGDACLGLASRQGVSLHVHLQPGLPTQLLGDSMRLRQVVSNLLGNAVKFSGGRSTGGRVSLRVEASTDELALSVQDDGVGLTAEAMSRLFQPFEQAEASTTRRFGGTGLGLAISHRLVQAMGGRISVLSEPGAGARFTVHLPLRPLPDTQAEHRNDLAGVHCTWQGPDCDGLDDWCTSLQAAGAGVSRESLPHPMAGDALGRWCVRRGDATALVRLRAGQRRRAVPDGADSVWLDVDGLHLDALLHAVLLALDPGASVAPCLSPADGWTAVTGTWPVLVAEDNPVNQLVIARQLQKLGVPSVMVSQGDEALSRWREQGGRFSLLLTDLHMPGLDGHGLCAAIRAEESAGRRLPILALTANAVRGEAERALAAGMDDYLVKPVPLDRLGAALRRWLPATAVTEGAPDDREGVEFDGEALSRAIGPDPEAQVRMREIYLATLARAETEMHAALQRGEWLTAGLAAHRVKSSSRVVGAIRLASLLDQFEDAARGGESERLAGLVPLIAAAADPVRKALSAA